MTSPATDPRLVRATATHVVEAEPGLSEPMSVEDDPLWQQENVRLRSVGVDVGSSGTQVCFSRLHLRRLGEDLTSRYVVVRREALYRSPVVFTPYRDQDLIDADALARIVRRAYADARVDPGAVDTGAVILTGEALRRRNAESITNALALHAGSLVCVAAGHHMEARLAAFGSGAARISHESAARVLNIDIGGGTTKLSILDRGEIVATAAVQIGGRLAVFDVSGRLVRLDPAGQRHAERAGFRWQLGGHVDEQERATVARRMAETLMDAVWSSPPSEETARFYLTAGLPDLGDVHGVMCSGGVAEYVYGRETQDFGDLGPLLGTAVRRLLDARDVPLLPAGECIRATVLGASEHTVQLSGNTGWLRDAHRLLPQRDLQVLRPTLRLGSVLDEAAVALAVRRCVEAFDVDRPGAAFGLALEWTGEPSHARISAFARGVAHGLAEPILRDQPLYLLLDGDVAMTLGRCLHDELGIDNDLLVLDGLTLGDFDFVDLGEPRTPSNTVPVTIKSLVFDTMASMTPPSRALGEPES